LFNLIQNSIKYTKQEGMIEITISLEKKMQSSLLDSPDYQFVTKIKDNGKKIDKNRIDYLFLTFGELRKKQNRTLVEDYGIGLGLSNSKEIAMHVGGDVTLVSSDEECNIFEVRVPIDVDESQIVLNSGLND